MRAPFVSPFSTIYGYDAAGRSTVTTLPNGTTASSTYDNAGRLTVLENKDGAGTTISRHEYTLDGNGNRTAANEVNGAFSGVTNFTYDDVNRLTAAVYPDVQAMNHRSVSYTYNDSGDRIEHKTWTGVPGSGSPLSTISYAYDEAGRMTTAAGVNYTHDRNGNQTGRGSDTFTFNALNRMTQAVISSATSTYTYDGNGVRTQKVTGGVTTDYLQDVNGRLPRVAAEKVGSAWTYYLYGKNLIARRASDQTVQYYHFDGTGNVRAISNAAGAVIQRYDYDAFGALRNTPSGGVTNDRRFSGEQQDAETGYSFLRARYYDPAIGRFTGRDAVEGGNSYAYTSNNPVNFVDPSGYSEEGGEWTPCPSGGCAAIGWNPTAGTWAPGYGPGAANSASGITKQSASKPSDISRTSVTMGDVQGFCLQGTFGIAVFWFEQACLVLAQTGDFGWTLTPVGSAQTTGGSTSIAVGGLWANASQISDLGGWFGVTGASGSVGLVAVGGDIFWGGGVWGYNPSAGFGAKFTGPVFPAEAHTGTSWTMTGTWFNIYDIIRQLRRK